MTDHDIDHDSVKLCGLLYNKVKGDLDKDSCFLWDENLDYWIKVTLHIDDPVGWLESLIQDKVLEEPILGHLRFIGLKGALYDAQSKEVKYMAKQEKETERPSVKKDAASITASKDAATSKQTTLTDASEVISSSSDFKLPKLNEFLGDMDEKEGILWNARIVKGKFGLTAILDLEAQ
jgi:hypothetical protein